MSAAGFGRVKTFRPRETGDAKLNLACCRKLLAGIDVVCPVRRERSGGADGHADAHPSRLDRRYEGLHAEDVHDPG